MHDEGIARRELDDQVLGTPGHGANRLALQTRGEVGAEWVSERRPAREHALDALSFHRAAQQTTDVFDFGKFWHAARLHRTDALQHDGHEAIAARLAERERRARGRIRPLEQIALQCTTGPR